MGVVERIGQTHVETSFGHWNFVPFIPGKSFLVLDSTRTIEIPSHRTSVLAGYARGWGWAVALGTFAGAGAVGGTAETALAVLGFGFFFGWIASFQIGTLSADEKARRRVYAKVTGYPVDPALFVHANPTLVDHLTIDLATRAEALAPDGYRGRTTDWRTAAASVDDPEFLALALTLSRIGAARDDASDPQLHAQIWARLSPRIQQLPERIDPVTRVASQEVAAPPAPTVAANVRLPFTAYEKLASMRGSAIEAGWDVTVPTSAQVNDGRCASCLQPATHVQRTETTFGRRAIDVPMCGACMAHAFASDRGGTAGATRLDRSRSVVQTLAVLLAFGMSGIGFAAMLPGAVTFPLAVMLATAVLVGVAFLVPPRRTVPPAHVSRTAARVVSARGSSMTLHCLNEEWARSLAERSGTTPRPQRRFFHHALANVPVISLAVLPLTFGAHWISHPALRIDNGHDEAIHVWIDGEDQGTIPPTKIDEKLPKSVNVGWGRHTFEWAFERDRSKRTKLDAQVEVGGGHLWDPGAKHCYWLIPTVYGKATVNESQAFARPRSDFYSFSGTLDWFESSPERESVGKVRYEVRRDQTCPQLAACPADVLERYWGCQKSTTTDAQSAACGKAAVAACNQSAETDDE